MSPKLGTMRSRLDDYDADHEDEYNYDDDENDDYELDFFCLALAR